MALIVVGGHSRNIGKTAVAAGLISAFPDRPWIAVKLTHFGHGVCSINGRTCGCAVEEHPFAIVEEQDRSGRSDTSRFLVAGAARSLWVRVKQGQVRLVVPFLRRLVESEPWVILESNSILRHIDPDLYITVLCFGVSDFKSSAREFLGRADAAVVVDSTTETPAWDGISRDDLAGIPLFRTEPPVYVPEGLVELVRARIG